MKTFYHTRDVWMNRFSVKLEPIHDTPYVRVWNRDNAAPETDVKWIASEYDLTGTHIPEQYREETKQALLRLSRETHVVDVIIYDEREGWGVKVTTCPHLENCYYKGIGATPAEALANIEELPWFWSRWVDVD